MAHYSLPGKTIIELVFLGTLLPQDRTITMDAGHPVLRKFLAIGSMHEPVIKALEREQRRPDP